MYYFLRGVSFCGKSCVGYYHVLSLSCNLVIHLKLSLSWESWSIFTYRIKQLFVTDRWMSYLPPANCSVFCLRYLYISTPLHIFPTSLFSLARSEWKTETQEHNDPYCIALLVELPFLRAANCAAVLHSIQIIFSHTASKKYVVVKRGRIRQAERIPK